MGDLSVSFNPADIATASDAASDAVSKIASVSDAASDALSKVGVKVTGSGITKITVGISAPGSPATGDVWIDTSAALSNTISDALSKIAIVSAAASDAMSSASDALSKIAAVSDGASKARAKTVILKIYNEASAIASGDGKMYFTAPASLNGMNLTSVGGHLYTAATSGVVAVQINNVTSGVDMLSASRKLEWDATEKDTATAVASSAVRIPTANDGVATGEEIRIDIDDPASGAKGMELRLTFQLP